MRGICILLCAAAVGAGEAAPAPVQAPAQQPDPTQAVVAEGAFLYRQRDLDALLLVALRHARAREFAADGKATVLSGAETEQIRQALIAAMPAREALAAALAALPERVTPAARDAIALDILAYRAEANPRQAAPASPVPAAAVPAAAGPVLVRLPPISITRAIDGKGRRQLTLGLALAFADAAAAQALEAQAPVIQDAVLGALRGMGPDLFFDPDHAAVKARLAEAIRARLPSFPADGLLVPQLETAPADPPADR